jgi:phosphatidate phosphatase PAH1
MMGRLKSDQGQLFYEFCPDDAVPEDHLVRRSMRLSICPGFTTNLYLIIRNRCRLHADDP